MATLIRFHKTGGPEVLQYDRVEAPPLQAGEIRLRVEAIGLNRAEVMFREGQSRDTRVPVADRLRSRGRD